MNKTIIGALTLGIGIAGINALQNDTPTPTSIIPISPEIQTDAPLPSTPKIEEANNKPHKEAPTTTEEIIKNIPSIKQDIPIIGPSLEENVTTKKDTETPSNTTNSHEVTQARCDPNYSGCVPIDTDVDCAGGRGNGPSYVKGPVQVIGRDIYDLDRDNDGIGCE